MRVKITRTHLEPLKKKWQLKNLLSAEFINGSFDDNGNLFSMTFQLKNGLLQDMALSFEKHHLPCVLISEPYFFNNAEIEVLDE